jgi:hypothetical protein
MPVSSHRSSALLLAEAGRASISSCIGNIGTEDRPFLERVKLFWVMYSFWNCRAKVLCDAGVLRGFGSALAATGAMFARTGSQDWEDA